MAVGFDKFDVDNELARLRKVSDDELICEGRAARYMGASSTNFRKPPRDRLRCRTIQLLFDGHASFAQRQIVASFSAPRVTK